MQVQAIFFDLDDTLVDDAASYPAAIERLCAEFGPGFDADRLRAAYDILSPDFWAAGDLSAIREELWRRALERCGYDTSLASAVRDAYLRHRVTSTQLLPGVTDVLDVLAGRHRLAVITNGGSDIQHRRLQHLGLHRYFEFVLASTDVNAGKPEAAIFEYALRRMNLEPASAWHVGDGLHTDVAGALNAGLGAAVWLNRHAAVREERHPAPHHEIRALSELIELLDKG
jgi:HAD superfamily hydrolase (TIGR01493 family)